MAGLDDVSTKRHRFLIRFAGDVGTKKGRALVQFRARLARNAKDALAAAGIAGTVETTRGRLYVTAESADAEGVLSRVFGIQSLSPIDTLLFQTLDDVVDQGEELFGDQICGKTFAVRARRSSIRDQIDFTSEDVERALGSRLLGRSAGVDLENPEVTARVELTATGAHYFRRIVRCEGGLPIGCEGRALCLVSGGIDSLVAAWYMLKRGLELDYLFYNLGGSAHRLQVTRIVKILADRWSYGSRPRLYVVDLRPWADQLRERTDPRLWQVLLKRLMLVGANRLLRLGDNTALVTGESLGQVSSQTLANLTVIEQVSETPVLRPLIGFDKLEIVEVAKRIGTFELSAQVQEYCALQGKGPSAAADSTQLAENETSLDLAAFIAGFDDLRYLDLRQEDAVANDSDPPGSSPGPPGVDQVPADSTIIDLRPRAAFATWHYPGAERLDYEEALKAAPHLPSGRTYLICCEVEFKSAHVAESMRESGRTAYYFNGGTSKMMRYAAKQDLVDLASIAPAVR